MTKKSLETLADPKKYSPDVVAVAETAMQLERIADALEQLDTILLGEGWTDFGKRMFLEWAFLGNEDVEIRDPFLDEENNGDV